MAIVATIFGMLGRFAGKLLTTTLGWASTLLFGRVSQDRQAVLAGLTFGSLVWVGLVVGVIVPDIGTFLIGFVPVPDFVDESWVRLAMLAGAIVLPVLIGAATIYIRQPDDRPHGLGLVRELARGYPLAFALAVTLVFLAAVAIVRKARSLVKRWSDGHVPIVVHPGHYDRLVDDLEQALDGAGLAVAERAAPAVLATPARLLAGIAGSGLGSLVPDRLVQLVGRNLEIIIHPSDVAISGAESELARARAALASRLTTSAAWLTTSAEAQAVEDRLREVAERGAQGADVERQLAGIDEDVAGLTIPYDEWEVLYRERLQVERDLLRGTVPSGSFPGRRAPEPRRGATAARAGARDPLPTAVGAAGLVLVVLDVVLAVLDRLRPARGASAQRFTAFRRR